MLITMVILLVLFFMSAYIIDDSLYNFVMRFRYGVEEIKLLYKGDYFHFLGGSGLLPGQPQRSLLLFLIFPIFLIIKASNLELYKEQFICLLITLLISFLICIDYYKVPLDYLPHTTILMLAVPIGAFLAIIFMTKKKIFEEKGKNFLILAIVFPCLQYSFALGTHNDVWLKLFQLCFFSFLALLPLVALLNRSLAAHWRVIMTIAVISQLFTVAHLQLAMEHPIHQVQALRLQKNILDIKNTKGHVIRKLFVSSDNISYIKKITKIAFNNGFIYGDSIIDLTGVNPTTLYIMGAKSIGSPWNIGYYPGSIDYVSSIIKKIPCTELVKSWIYISLNGPYKINLSVLELNGLNKRSYKQVGNIINAPTSYIGFKNEKYQLMKPVGDYQESIDACEKARTRAHTDVAGPNWGDENHP